MSSEGKMTMDELLDWGVDLIKGALKESDERVRENKLKHAIKRINEARRQSSTELEPLSEEITVLICNVCQMIDSATSSGVEWSEWDKEQRIELGKFLKTLYENRFGQKPVSLDKILEIINSEPELPGEMPDENFKASTKYGMELTLRAAVRATKKNIAKAVQEALGGNNG